MRKQVIFISYSWDSPEHKAWVKKFSDDLQVLLGDNYEVLLDQNLPRGYSFTRFMVNGIKKSDKVLVIGTPTYKKKSDSSGGVAYENLIISQELFNDIDTTKFIPILRKGSFAESFPIDLRKRNAFDFSNNNNYEDELRQLANEITEEERLPSMIMFMHGSRTTSTDKGIEQTNVDNKNITEGNSEQSNENTNVRLEEHQNKTDDYTFETNPNIIYTESVSNILNHTISGVEYSDDKKKLISVPKDSKDTFIILDYVTEIGDSAFEDCTNLISIVIPSSVTKIGRNAFRGCTNLFSLVIPNSVTKIGDNAFNCCSKLTSIMIPNSVTEIREETFLDCTNLTSIVIPDSVTKIGDRTFSACSNITSMVIPNSVTEIGRGAFEDCSKLSSIVISNSVEEIGRRAFDSCTNLETIHFKHVIPKVFSENAFRGIEKSKVTLYVPFGSKYDYRISEYYQGFKDIIEEE